MEHMSRFPTTSEQSTIISMHDFNPTCNSINPNLTIIFFHTIALGKYDNWKETWTSQSHANGKEELVCWPEKWLPEDLGENVRILSMSCNATFTTDLTEISKNILQVLVLRYEKLWEAPIVLVGHSFGGLMLKSLVVEVSKCIHRRSICSLDATIQDSCKKFFENVNSIVFYSVPDGGGSQEFLSFFASQCFQTNVIDKNIEHASKNLNSFNRQMDQLDADFTHSIDENCINLFAFYEGQRINDKQGFVVPLASSKRLSKYNYRLVEDANHLTICKPPNKDHPSYYILLQILQLCLKESTILPVLPTFEVDLTPHAKNVIELLEKVSIVGLVGMAGIGKTTLSKKIYHLIHNQYEKSSFLPDVRSRDVTDVMKQLLCNLCDKKLHKDEDVNEHDFQLIRQCLITKKALVVIDDVNFCAIQNLVALQFFVVISKIESKSKVIVNCRNWGILKAFVSEDGKVDMPLINDVQARELFMFHAFGGASYVPERFEEISNKVAAACHGLPLSLKYLGEFLKGMDDMELWEDVFIKLHKTVPIFTEDSDLLNSTLRIMYDELTMEEKDIFLDIACFFCDGFFVEKGLRITTARRIWDSFGLLNLQDKSLINITENGIIVMHQHLRNLGREISWDQKRNRSWDPKETLRLFSHQNEVDINSLEGISLLGCEEVSSLLDKNNMKFPNLRLLDMRKTSSNVVKNCIRKKRFKKLKWISLQASDIQKLPNDLANYSHLNVLDLAGCQYLEQLPNFFGSKLVQLQEFDLSGCSKLENLPNGIGGMVNLQHLSMKDCVKLQKLPTSIGQMSNLHKFDLSGCLNVQELPTSIGSLNVLCELNLSKCSKLQELPTSIGQLKFLEYLNISWCRGLQELPITIGDLHALQKFDLSNCFKIRELPASIGKLINLQEFNLSRCFALHELPISIGQLIALQKLDLSDCSNLLELPTSVGKLNALKEFNLSRCSKLQKLPSSIDKLITLQELNLSMCLKLESLPNGIGGMLSLQHLLVKDCVKLQELPTSIGLLSALCELNLSKCEGLQELPNTIGELHALQKFDLSNCFKIQKLPKSIGKLINLHDFNLSKCSALHALPTSIGQLITLQKFDLSECSNLLELPSIGQLVALQKLNLSGCSELKELPTSIGQLITLQELNLLQCLQLQKLPTSIEQLITLQKFDVSGCVKLQVLPTSIGLLSNLQELNLSGCSKLQELPISICQLHLLKELSLSYCYTLCELPNDPMGKLNALQCLDLFGCFGLQELPAITIGQLNMLQELDMYGCSGLQELPKSIEQLIVLKKLNLNGCSRLQNLPTSIGQLCALQIFNLSNCSVLEKLPTSIGQLSLLQEFDLSRCFKLVNLPISIGELNSLQIFNLSECYMLKELPSSIGELINLEELNLSKCYGLKELPSSIIELIALGNLNLVGWSNWQDKISRRRQETQQMLGTMIQSSEDPSNRSPTTLQSHFPERKGMKKIVFMGKKAMKGDSCVEFLYPDAKDMARVVGVGINRAMVVVTNHFDVKVIEVEDEDIWTNLWNSKKFVPMAIFLPNSPTERECIAQSNLILENPSRSLGVGLIGNDGTVHVEGNNTLQGDQHISPLILDLAEHMGLIRESLIVFEAGSTSGSSGDGKNPARELQRRRSPRAFKSCVQPRTICIKDYESSEENEGDITFLVEDPLHSPPSSSLGAKVSKDIVGIGGQSRIINLGQRSGRSINDNAIRGHNKTSRSSHVISGQSTRNNVGETSGLPQDERKVGEDDSKPSILMLDNPIDDPPFSLQEEVGEKKVLNVTIYPRKAGTFFDRSTNNFDIPEDHLKNATISPILEFNFELEGKHGKTITTTTKTKCSFGENNHNPSYYQNKIKISLKCEEAQNPPRLTKDEVEKLEPVKKTVTVMSNTSDSLLDGGSATLGITMLGNQLGGSLTHTHTVGTGITHTQSIETIVDQLDGFEVNRESQESNMIYRFNYPRQSLDHAIAQFQDTGFPKICNTFEPSIIGEWHVSDTDVNNCAGYNFEVERRFFSIEDLIQSRKDGTSNLRSIPQLYQVRLEVNHAMSHIHNYRTLQLLEGAGIQDLPNVIKAHVAN